MLPYSISKPGMKDVYQHCAEKHRYLSTFSTPSWVENAGFRDDRFASNNRSSLPFSDRSASWRPSAGRQQDYARDSLLCGRGDFEGGRGSWGGDASRSNTFRLSIALMVLGGLAKVDRMTQTISAAGNSNLPSSQQQTSRCAEQTSGCLLGG
jgi:hypothetical protein